MNIKIGDITLTTEHAASSYGSPVMLAHGQVFGPRDQYHGDPADSVMSYFSESARKTVLMAAKRAGLENHELVRKFCA